MQVLQRYEERAGDKRKSGSGRPALKMPPSKIKKMIKEATNKVGATQRQMATKYEISVEMSIVSSRRTRSSIAREDQFLITIQVSRRELRQQLGNFGDTFFPLQDQHL